MSDSLISGQPLYLLYSQRNAFAPGASDSFFFSRATHATGSVRLHVTGRPPTTSGASSSFAHESNPAGNVATSPA